MRGCAQRQPAHCTARRNLLCSRAQSSAATGPRAKRQRCSAAQGLHRNLAAGLAAGLAIAQALGAQPALADAAPPTPAIAESAGSVNTVVQQEMDGINRRVQEQEASVAKDARQVEFNIEIGGQPAGRVVVQLYDDAPVGSARFFELAKGGAEGIDYRLTKIDGIAADYIRSGSLKSLSYRDGQLSSLPGGDTVEQLEAELAESKLSHSGPGVVSLLVKDTLPRKTTEKLVAYQGRLVSVQQTSGEASNGTAFAVTVHAAPQLNATNLVVGHVVEGMDVVHKITSLPTVKSNSASPFFRAAKTFGDKRADVAEKGFGRPLVRVVISSSSASQGEH